jgi:hypothetical protein
MTLLLVYNVGYFLDVGLGVAAPDYPAAADWHRRAAGAYTCPLFIST